jgi:hypothetical protein
MADIKFGEVDWESADLPSDNRESAFMQLKQGDNKVRVLSNPQQFAVHWVVDETGKKRKVNCATSGCPVCLRGQDGDKPQARWLIKVMNRETSKIKLLEITSQVLRGIKDLVKNADWGPVTEYDVYIKRAAPGTQPLYSVVPGRHAPITTEEKHLLAEFNKDIDVARFITPPTPEVLAEKLGWTLGANTKNVSNDFRSSGTTGGTSARAGGKPAVNFDFDS